MHSNPEGLTAAPIYVEVDDEGRLVSLRTKSESVRATGFGDETGRLAELGEMTGEELAALQEDANVARLRLGTPAERISGGGRNAPGAVTMDQQDVQLSERVQAARRSSARAGVRSDSRGLA